MTTKATTITNRMKKMFISQALLNKIVWMAISSFIVTQKECYGAVLQQSQQKIVYS